MGRQLEFGEVLDLDDLYDLYHMLSDAFDGFEGLNVRCKVIMRGVPHASEVIVRGDYRGECYCSSWNIMELEEFGAERVMSVIMKMDWVKEIMSDG